MGTIIAWLLQALNKESFQEQNKFLFHFGLHVL